MTLNKRLQAIENSPDMIIQIAYAENVAIVERFIPARDALFNAWIHELRAHVADHHPDLLHLFDKMEAVLALPDDEQDAATVRYMKAHYDDNERLSAIFTDLYKAAHRGDIAPLVDCREYHDFIAIIDEWKQVMCDFRDKHPRAMSRTLADRIDKHIQQVIADHEQKFR